MSERDTTRSRARAVAERLHRRADEKIDYSDIPPLGEDFFATAELLMPVGKTEISLRLDRDVVQYFRGGGKGYQSRINAVLRAYMIGAKRRHKRAS